MNETFLRALYERVKLLREWKSNPESQVQHIPLPQFSMIAHDIEYQMKSQCKWYFSLPKPSSSSDKEGRDLAIDELYLQAEKCIGLNAENFFQAARGEETLVILLGGQYQVQYDAIFQCIIWFYQTLQIFIPIVMYTDGDPRSRVYVDFHDPDKRIKYLDFYNEEYLLKLFEKYKQDPIERPISRKVSADKELYEEINALVGRNGLVGRSLAPNSKSTMNFYEFLDFVMDPCIHACCILGYTYDEFVAALIVSINASITGQKSISLTDKELFLHELEEKGF